MKNYYLLLTFLVSVSVMSSQDYKQMISDGTYTVQQIQTAAEVHFAQVGTERGKGYKPYKRWEYQALRQMDENGMLPSPEFYFTELENYNSYLNENGSSARTTVGSWEQLGPESWNATSGWNPGVGRITSVAVESANPNHIIAGADTGGVWRSIDAGLNWTVLTDNLSNLNVSALTIHPTVNTTYFWGSGSGIIFISTDSGITWNILADTGNGAVNKILIDPTNTNKMYCSVQGGGLYKSTDSGSNWSLIDNSATTGYDVEFKSGDTNTIFASGTSFYRSIDGGNTFTSPNGLDLWSQEYILGQNNWSTGGANQNNTVTPKTGNAMGICYIGNFSSPVTNLITPVLNLGGALNAELKFSYTNVNWEGDIDTMRVLYKTTESGNWLELASYTAESTLWTDIVLSLPNVTSTYYIAFEGTANYGRGFTLDDISIVTSQGVLFEDGFESASNTFSSGVKMIGVSTNDPTVVYILEASGGAFGNLHKSTDSGLSFTALNHTGKNYFGYSSNPEDPDDAGVGQAPRDMDIAVNPSDVNDVHIAGVNTWRSTDGGVSFTSTSQWTPGNANGLGIGYCHADVDILQFVNDKLYVGTDGGLYVAENPTIVNTTYYKDLTGGMGIRQFYKIGISQTDPVVVTGGSQDNGTSIMDENGDWTDWLGADGMESFVDKNNTNIIYGTSQFGSLYKSFNSGLNALFIGSPEDKSGNWITPFEQDPILSNVIYTGYDEVYKSIDGGNSWTSVSQNFGGNLNHLKIAPSNSNYQFAARGSTLYRNTSVGTTANWSSVGGFLGSINSIAVHPTNPNKVAIATTGDQRVYVSLNAGDSWTSYKFNLPNFSAQALAWHDNGENGLYLGMNYGIYYIDDTFTEWQPFSNGLPNVIISELEVNTANNKIYAGTYGRGLWSSDVFDATLSVNEFALESFEMYPNPAKNRVTINWNKSDLVSIRIFDALGKLMYFNKNIDISELTAIDVSQYSSGLYFVKINNLKGSVTKKLIIE